MLNVYMDEKNENIVPFVKGGLINILNVKPKHYFVIEQKTCACNTKNGIAVDGFSIIINNLDNYVKCHENYIFEFGSKNELESAIFWLVKSKFNLYDYKFEKVTCENIKKVVFNRYLSEKFFYISFEKCGCKRYTTRGKPVLCMESMVITSNNIGPTIKSAIK